MESSPLPRNPTTMHGWFEHTATRHADATALDLAERRITYEELSELSARVAGRLAGLGLAPGARIALVGGRTLATYAAYLAILRLGHTVVPLAPDGPPQRNQRILTTARVAALVCDPSRYGTAETAVAGSGIPVVDPEGCLRDPDGAVRTPGVEVSTDAVAYLLFTSGSSGRPKGVPITHAAASAFLREVVPAVGLRPGMRLSHTFALTFDVSVYDLFAAWASGATLVVPHRNEAMLPVSYVNRREVTHWFSAPSLITYAERLGTLTPGVLPTLVSSMFIGEQLTTRQAAAWRRAAPDSTVVNQYGPTELTVACSSYRLPDDPARWPTTRNGTVPIGTVYPGLEWLVVDERGLPAPEGELIVRGPQRFGGYLDPADDAGRFARAIGGRAVPVQGSPRPGDYYRTGDRVLDTDGVLVHLGRLDRQVKINGIRVELGEIEAAFRRHPAITDVVVVTLPDAAEGPSLSAAYCGEQIPAPELTAFLREHLPAGLVPGRLLHLTELPRNANGKVDLAAVSGRITTPPAGANV